VGGGGVTYFVDADLGLHILEPLLEDGDERGRWHQRSVDVGLADVALDTEGEGRVGETWEQEKEAMTWNLNVPARRTFTSPPRNNSAPRAGRWCHARRRMRAGQLGLGRTTRTTLSTTNTPHPAPTAEAVGKRQCAQRKTTRELR